MIYWILGVNPEPWRVGTAYRRGAKGVGIAKDTKLLAYQSAVAEEFERQNPDVEMFEGDLTVKFWFWRSTAHGQPCDLTNVLKATEDALQGVLFENDKNNRRVQAVMVEQAPDARPAILIDVRPYLDKFDNIEVPEAPEVEKFSGSSWTAPEGEAF